MRDAKRVSVVMTVLVGMILIAGCGGGGGDTSGGEGGSGDLMEPLSRTGWVATEAVNNGVSSPMAVEDKDLRLGVSDDGNFNIGSVAQEQPDYHDTGTWTVTPTQMILSGNRQTITLNYVLNSSTSLTISGNIPYYENVILHMVPLGN